MLGSRNVVDHSRYMLCPGRYVKKSSTIQELSQRGRQEMKVMAVVETTWGGVSIRNLDPAAVEQAIEEAIAGQAEKRGRK